jgi:hypothetical protein
MKITHLMTAAALATLMGGAAYAQDQAAPATPDPSMPAPAPAATPPAQYNYNANSGATTAPASSSTLGDPATMKAGDASVVSNGPVPDTPANRARYGKPMSNAGKKSTPAGN